MIARIIDADVKNLAARLSNFITTAGRYHSNSPQMYEWAEVTKIGINDPTVLILG